MTPFLISPPFGTYFNHPEATPVLGSFTLHRRPGRWYKTLQFFWDNWNRPVPGGYCNRIGLRNPGIASIFDHHDVRGRYYSLVGLADDDWKIMLSIIDAHVNTHVRFELNLGCPNVHEYGIEYADLEAFCRRYWCGVKLPADMDKAMKIAEMAVKAGAHFLHAGNTVASEWGGLSGAAAKAVNLPIVEALARAFPDIHIVGGGGNYTYRDILDYNHGGAVSYSLATAWMHPQKARFLIRQYEMHFGESRVCRLPRLPRLSRK